VIRLKTELKDESVTIPVWRRSGTGEEILRWVLWWQL